MARVVKAYDVRRNELLAVAQQFFHVKGYEQTSIRDIIEDIGIAKGTFYHYFDSKQDLLDAVVGQMIDQAMQLVEPIVEDDRLSAPEKLERLFASIQNWKIEDKAFFLDLLRVWYKDENAILRQRIGRTCVISMAPILSRVIRQGIEEGVFVTDYPDDVGEIALIIGQSLDQALGEMLLNNERDRSTLDRIERKAAVYEHALERLLGAVPGSLNLLDVNTIKLWLD